MKRDVIIGCLIVLVLAVGGTYPHYFSPHAKTMPEGWSLLCDAKGNYTWQTPQGFINEVSIKRSAHAARIEAWDYWTYLQRPHLPRNENHVWHLCGDAQ